MIDQPYATDGKPLHYTMLDGAGFVAEAFQCGGLVQSVQHFVHDLVAGLLVVLEFHHAGEAAVHNTDPHRIVLPCPTVSIR